MPAIVAFGASFGVLARAAGIDALAALVMSATTFAGSAQFAVVSVLGAGGTAAAAIGAAVLLNARYVPMAFAAAGAFRGGPLRRLLEAQLLVDESWALSSREGGFDRKVLVGAGGLLYVGLERGHGGRRARGRQPHRPCDARPGRCVPRALPGSARPDAPVGCRPDPARRRDRSAQGSRCSSRRSRPRACP